MSEDRCPFCGAKPRRPGCLWWPIGASELESRRTESCYESQISQLQERLKGYESELADYAETVAKLRERLDAWRMIKRSYWTGQGFMLIRNEDPEIIKLHELGEI